MLASAPAIRETKTDVDIKRNVMTKRYNNAPINHIISFVVKFMFTINILYHLS